MFCGRSETMGHGDIAVCGEKYWDEIWQCGECARKENKRLRNALNEIEMNTKSASITLSQAHYKLEMVNRIAKAALREVDGGKD